MRTITFEGASVAIPDEIMFCFNPNRFTLQTENEVTVTITDGLTTYTDVRSPLNDKVTFDVSPYARTLIHVDRKTMIVPKSITVTIQSSSDTKSFTTLCIWGAMNVGERFNQPRKVTWFKGFPFTFSMYIPDGSIIRTRYDKNTYSPATLASGLVHINPEELFDATEFGVIRLDNEISSSVWEYTFDSTFRGTDEGTLINRLVVDECTKGVYLRWIDRHGFYQYYLFKDGDNIYQSKAGGEVLNEDYTSWYNFGDVQLQQKKEFTQSIKACATLIDKDNFSMLSTLFSSPLVDMWFDGAWLPVRIADATTTDTKKPLQDVEIEILMPTIKVQSL